MNENYLSYLLSTSNPFTYEMSYEMNANDMWERIQLMLKEITPDVSFIKKDGIRPHRFMKEKLIFKIDVGDLSSEEMEYFRNRLLESLRVPMGFHEYINQPIQYIDEYH